MRCNSALCLFWLASLDNTESEGQSASTPIARPSRMAAHHRRRLRASCPGRYRLAQCSVDPAYIHAEPIDTLQSPSLKAPSPSRIVIRQWPQWAIPLRISLTHAATPPLCMPPLSTLYATAHAFTTMRHRRRHGRWRKLVPFPFSVPPISISVTVHIGRLLRRILRCESGAMQWRGGGLICAERGWGLGGLVEARIEDRGHLVHPKCLAIGVHICGRERDGRGRESGIVFVVLHPNRHQPML